MSAQHSAPFDAKIEITVAADHEALFDHLTDPQKPDPQNLPPFPLSSMMEEDGYTIEKIGQRTFRINSTVGINIDYLSMLYDMAKKPYGDTGSILLDSALVTHIAGEDYRIGFDKGRKHDSSLAA